MAATAELIQAVMASPTSPIRGKLQVIQEGLPALPPDSLSDFVVGFSEIVETEIATPNRAEHTAVFISFIQLWYERVLFALAEAKRPVDSDTGPSDWPDRWFEQSPTL